MDVYRSEIGMVIFYPVQRTALSSLLLQRMGVSIGTTTIMLMSMVPFNDYPAIFIHGSETALARTLSDSSINCIECLGVFQVMEPFGDDNGSVKELKDYESRLVILIGNSGTIDLPDDHGLKLISESRRQQNLPPLRPHWQ
ncbi:hypothetical protein OIU77_020882 [Salix suchowensis]|uniref:Uncharacterized protein n=1 Tax=Salix suchowensis TaxID=1278906 RepID=A0ABQ9CBQ5_9ROSI|nr:hypothetical protein OIU77_020882 [Salix suchowensis]